jgi:DNA-binding MarR family transcriptional regulator
MDDLLTGDEFVDRPRDGYLHNAHVYAEYHRLAAEQAALRRVAALVARGLALSDDLSGSQAAVLTRLHKEGPSSASALASAEAVSHQAIGPILAVLEKRGYIRRSPDPTDGRRQLISLTAAGVAHAENHLGTGGRLFRALQDRLTEDERRAVRNAMALLNRLAEPDSATTD